MGILYRTVRNGVGLESVARTYPYIGQNIYHGGTIEVLFVAEGKGTVIYHEHGGNGEYEVGDFHDEWHEGGFTPVSGVITTTPDAPNDKSIDVESKR